MKIRKTERIITDTHFVCEVCEYSDTDIEKVKECEKSHKCSHDLCTSFDEDDNLFHVNCKKCWAKCKLDIDAVEYILNSDKGRESLEFIIGHALRLHRNSFSMEPLILG